MSYFSRILNEVQILFKISIEPANLEELGEIDEYQECIQVSRNICQEKLLGLPPMKETPTVFLTVVPNDFQKYVLKRSLYQSIVCERTNELIRYQVDKVNYYGWKYMTNEAIVFNNKQIMLMFLQ